MPQLSGEDLQDLHGALLEAFPTLDGLAQLLTFRLGANLQAIAGASNLSDATFKVITWAEATGRTRALITGARDENPGNERLSATAARLLTVLDTPHVTDVIPWWRRLSARRANLLFGAGWCAVTRARCGLQHRARAGQSHTRRRRTCCHDEAGWSGRSRRHIDSWRASGICRGPAAVWHVVEWWRCGADIDGRHGRSHG